MVDQGCNDITWIASDELDLQLNLVRTKNNKSGSYGTMPQSHRPRPRSSSYNRFSLLSVLQNENTLDDNALPPTGICSLKEFSRRTGLPQLSIPIRRKSIDTALNSDSISSATSDIPDSPLSADILRQKIHQVIDPALKYSSSAPKTKSDCGLSYHSPTIAQSESLSQLQESSRLPLDERGYKSRKSPRLSSIEERLEPISSPKRVFDTDDCSRCSSLSETVRFQANPFENLEAEARIGNGSLEVHIDTVSNVLFGLGCSVSIFSNTGAEQPVGYWWDTLPPYCNIISSNKPNDIDCERSQEELDRVLAVVTSAAFQPPDIAQDMSISIEKQWVARRLRRRMCNLPRSIRIRIWLMAMGFKATCRSRLWENALASFENMTAGGQQVMSEEYENNRNGRNFVKCAAKPMRKTQSAVKKTKPNPCCETGACIYGGCGLLQAGQSQWVTFFSPQELLKWCKEATPKSHESHIIVILINALNFGYYEFADGNVKGRDGSMNRALTLQSDLERLLTGWVMALRRLPAWTKSILVDTGAPMWVDARDLGVFLARMWCVAKFKTHGQVSWDLGSTHLDPLSSGETSL